jgi:uncharacterized membrane protein
MLTTFRARWFWYAVLAIFSWAGWVFSAKFGSDQLPPNTEQFMAAFGFLLLGLVVFASMRFRIERSRKGLVYGVCCGVLLASGAIASFAAYRTGANTAVVTTLTAMYPMVTVVLAVLILRERLNRYQSLGILFAIAAMVIFSL